MLISFIWGRQVFKVNYNYKKIIAYSLLAVGLFFISLRLTDVGLVLRLSINTTLIMVYLMVVFFVERKYFIKGKQQGAGF
jgi:hypothetical protein